MTPPNQTALHEAALAYLSHRSASVAQLTRVLSRKVDAWARKAARTLEEDEVTGAVAKAREHVEAVIASLRRSGLLDDAKYAKSRAGSLTRAGKSRRAIQFDLSRRGVSRELVRESVPSDGETELIAAVTLTRKRRLGPFARDDVTDEKKKKWFGVMARAGYSASTAQRALRMDREAAEELLRGSRPVGW